MKTLTYSITGAPGVNGQTYTKSASLTGSTEVTFTFDNLSGYDDTSTQKINKIIVDCDWEDEELIFVRPLSGTEIVSLSSDSFTKVLETDFTDTIKRNVYLTLYRDDAQVDVRVHKFTMHKPSIDVYENVNLYKTDYFTNSTDEEKVLLSFINKNPEVLGLGIIDLDIDDNAAFDPNLSTSQYVSANSFNVGFTTEYVHTYAEQSNTGPAIQISLEDIINPATGLPKENGKISLKWRTRGADGNDVHHSGGHALPNNPDLFYIPLTANSSFMHLSGVMTWNCGDLLKDIDLSTKTITIPLVDIIGTRTTLEDYYFTNVNVGIGGTTTSGLASGGYFYVDLYDISSCDTITTGTSTITAYVNY